MGFYRDPVAPTKRARTRTRTLPTRVRVSAGGLGNLTTFIQSKYPGLKTTTTTAPAITVKSSLTPMISPTPVTSGASIQTTSRTFSPVAPAPTPTTPTTTSPTPTSTFSPTSPTPTPTDTSSSTSLPGGTETSSAGVVGTGSTSSGAPAGSGSPLYVRFDAGSASPSPFSLPDQTGPEIYNEDGTPVTPAAKTATVIDKIKNLPTAAKIGGVVALYILLGRH